MENAATTHPLTRWWPAVALPVFAASTPTPSPDAIELAVAGACIWQAPFDSAACAGLEPWFWPPLFPLLAGPAVLAGVDPALAATVVAAACMALVVVPACWLAGKLGGPTASLLCGAVLLATPVIRAHARMGEARPLFLLLLFSGMAAGLAAMHSERRRDLVVAGGLLGLAALARPEALLTGGVLVGGALVLTRGRTWPALAAWLTPLLPYWGALSLAAGRPTLTSRGWQKAAYGWLEVLPEEWVRLDLAAGAWGSPLRRALSTSELAGAVPATLDVGAATGWLTLVARESLPWWLVLLALVGGLTAARRPLVAGALLLAAAPALVVLLIPQAQDVVLPANNALPVVVVAGILAATGAAWLLARLEARVPRLRELSAIAGLAAIGLMGALSTAPVLETGHDPTTQQAAAAWLAAELPPTEPVACSLATAPLVLASDRPRRHLPAPWSVSTWGAGKPAHLVLSHLDLPAAAATLRTLRAQGELTLRASFGDAHGWVSVWHWEPQPPATRTPG